MLLLHTEFSLSLTHDFFRFNTLNINPILKLEKYIYIFGTIYNIVPINIFSVVSLYFSLIFLLSLLYFVFTYCFI